jgi:hypothetical protein
MAVQEAGWKKVGREPAEEYTFLYGNGTDNHHLQTGFFMQNGSRSTVKNVEFISDGMSYNTKRSLV